MEWHYAGGIADPAKRARLLMAYAHEVRRSSIVCRRQAMALCDEARRLRARASSAAPYAGEPLAADERSTINSE